MLPFRYNESIPIVRFKAVSAARNKELIRSMWVEAAKGKFEGFLNLQR